MSVATAQRVKEVTVAEARRILAKGKQVPGKRVWLFPASGGSVSVQQSTKEGHVRLLITGSCSC
jgi:hypothetical protein